jgi:hypothetical protein
MDWTPIDIGSGPNTGDGEILGRNVWQRVNGNFAAAEQSLQGVIYQDNLGDIGFPPVINQQGAIEALVSHRLNTPANLAAEVLADGEIAVEREGTLQGLRIGDGVTAGGKRIASRQTFAVSPIAFQYTTFTTVVEVPWTPGGQGFLYGRLRFSNSTGDTVQWRILGTGTQRRICVVTNKSGSPATTDLSFLGTIASGVIQHSANMESVIVPSVIDFATTGAPLILEIRKASHTSGNATLNECEIIFEPI